MYSYLLHIPVKMELIENSNYTTKVTSQNICFPYFPEEYQSSTASSNEFVLGAVIGIIFTIFMRYYLSTSIPSHKCHNLQFLTTNRSRYLFSILCLLMSTVLLPLLAVVVIIFGTYRLLVHLILKQKYGKKYGGLVSGRDVIWVVEDQSKNLINGVMIVEERDDLDKTVPEAVRDRVIKEIMIGNLRDSKFTSTIHRKFGYLYLLKDTVHPSEYISEFDTDDPNQEFMTHEELRKKLSEVGNLPLPKNHSVHMEVLIGKKPILWKKTDTKKCYACIFKVHHSLADGICILQILTNCFTDGPIKVKETLDTSHEYITGNNNNNNNNNITRKAKTTNDKVDKFKEDTYWNVVQNVIKFLGEQLLGNMIILIFGPTTLAIQLWMRPTDVNPLHGPELSGEKSFYWKTEDDEELVELTRTLRKRIPGASFLDILFTAVSASFHEYFQKKSKSLPKYLTAVVPARMNVKEVEQLQTDKFVFTNNFTVGLFNMPVEVPKPHHIFSSKTVVLSRLRETMKQTHMLRHSIDFHINYWVMTVFNAIIPVPFLYPLFRFPHCTMIFSNLPGPEAFTVFDKLILRDLIFWLPNRGYIGVGVSCLSYDKRFQLGLIVDKALFGEDDDLQTILDNVPKYLRKLEKETAVGIHV
ncbi:uncharacterized protein LOC108733059 isoform X1 [Agrilus planipennis]|uniref:Uncharacterized protein LOC108733059 isoform X1 n=1 Tax=Agrilus planipennis TaxID=224129 RepID=A0A7F5RLS1_AGRPL|nr:uncharacterized protein LOC108733059 isoform X1 [Agrilus planipennis]